MPDDPNPTPRTPEEPSTTSLAMIARLWSYTNERKVVQWSVGYVALAYSVQQGVGLTVEAFEWPQVVLRVSMLLLALGLPLVVTLAWYHGDGGSQRVSGPELTIISMLLVVGSVLFFMFARPSAEQQGATPQEQASGGAARTGSAAEAGAVSLAVLPFANMSGDPAQEFFSDGMTEEITSALIKIPDLRVIARTSAFQYKGEKTDARAVGQALGVTHLIEGSVRRAGDRVRITAQLIQADTGVSLWTNNYDRVSTDVFAIQEEIARAIAGALLMPLGLALGEHLVWQSTIAPESYEQFLRARAIFRSRNQAGAAAPGPNRFAEVTNMLEQVVVRDPGYAPAWALLARTASSPEKREMAAREAIRLDPRSAMAYQALAGLEAAQGNRAGTEDLLEKALLLDPNDPEVLDGFSNQLALAGRLKESLAIREKLRGLEPFAPVYNFITASVMLYDGQGRAAIPILEALSAAPPRNAVLAHAYAAEGRYEEAANALIALAQNAAPQGAEASGQTVEAARLLRRIPTKLETPEALPIFENALNFVYVYVGAPDRVLDYQERQAARYPNLGSAEVRYLWSPEFAPVRQSERFKAFVRRIGLVDYWRARGWADRCRAQGADDFVCD